MKKQYSIRQHIAWLTLTPLLIMAVSLESFFLHDRFSALDQDLAERGQLIARQLASGSEYGVFSNNRGFLQNLAQGVLQQPDVQGVIILDRSAGVLVEAGKFSAAPEGSAGDAGAAMTGVDQAQSARVEKIRESVNAQTPVYRNSEALRIYQPIVPAQVMLDELEVTPGVQAMGAVILEMSSVRTGQLKSRMFWATAGSTLLFLIFPFCLIYLDSRNIISSIRRLSDAMRALGNGHLETRVAISTNVTELEILSLGINDLAAKLQQENAILHQRMEDAIRIAAIAFESHEGMMIVDPACMIVRVNKAFTRITGYTEQEAVGQTPHLLSSGHHETNFFAAMWESINTNGLWQGEIWNRRKTGEIYPAWLNITAVEREGNQVAYYVATYTDITVRKAAEDEIKNLAFNDALTQLPNRRMLIERLNQTMAAGKRSRRYGALMFIDLDNFKPLNDKYGHEVGDLLLIEVASRLVSCVREVDTVARFGGDEFVVMLSELDADRADSVLQAGIIAEKIRAILAEPYVLTIWKDGLVAAAVDHRCTSSIGVQLFIGHEASAEDVIKGADLSMYQAKRDGRDRVCFGEAE
ncbi:MAG: diguanylate cyclase [Nitrosomonadales bacterium]|nr:diguanylate cyclase [Nitrosomonadales bacterium]